MISWVLVIISAYLFFSIASFGDKLVLNRSQNPKLYIFYVGVLSLLVLLLIPFIGISFPSVPSFFWIILSSATLMAGLYTLYVAVLEFEVSKVVPIVGAVQPIFVLIFVWLFNEFEVVKTNNIWAFLILLVASVIISIEKKLTITSRLLRFSLSASLLTGLSFVLIKMVFLSQSFFNGIIWIGIFNFLFALSLLLSASFRKEVFIKKSILDKKTISLVLITQAAGGLGGILQNLAIYLAPFSSLAIINALRGIQYIFLFAITLIFSKFLPKILKEKVSGRIVLQKVAALCLIVIGLYILVLG